MVYRALLDSFRSRTNLTLLSLVAVKFSEIFEKFKILRYLVIGTEDQPRGSAGKSDRNPVGSPKGRALLSEERKKRALGEFRGEGRKTKRQRQSGKIGGIGDDRLASLEIQLLQKGASRQCSECKPCNAASGELVG